MFPFRHRDRGPGFTMIELMVVVVIVGILAGIAIPIYGKYVQNTRITEATSKIGEVITASKAYAQENQDASGNPIWPAGGKGIIDLTATEQFGYSITEGGGSNAMTTPFTITATGLAAGRMAGVTVSITVPNINASAGAPFVTGL